MFSLYVIYDHPRDYPEKYVIRRYVLDQPKELIGMADSLKEARKLIPEGLINIGRYPADDPVIAEVWV